MEKALVVKGVADKLYAAELSLDKTITDHATLLNSMIASRLELQLATTVGNAEVAKVTAALAALSEARTAIAEAHNALNRTRVKLGVRTKLGPWEKDEPDTAGVAYIDRKAG